jgi:hypothetical protein
MEVQEREACMGGMPVSRVRELKRKVSHDVMHIVLWASRQITLEFDDHTNVQFDSTNEVDMKSFF